MSDNDSSGIESLSDEDAEWLIGEFEDTVKEAIREKDMNPLVVAAGMSSFYRHFRLHAIQKSNVDDALDAFGGEGLLSDSEESNDQSQGADTERGGADE